MGMYSMIEDATNSAVYKLMQLGIPEERAIEMVVEALREVNDGAEPPEDSNGQG